MVGGFGSAAEAGETPLPPPAAETLIFSRDIAPIFQNSCLRCHGPEKSKSHFRLDNRISALVGGDKNTNDIVPNDSSHSLLIQYVAYRVEDMEMPPIDKGDRLTARQIGLLRAWIDQGALWSANEPKQPEVTLQASIGGIDVNGNKAKFRELEGVTSRFSGGVEKFSLVEQLGPDEKLAVTGHVLAPEQDMGLTLALSKTDVGFVQAGFDQWRKYYASDGGFDAALKPPDFTQQGDLFVDHGRA